MASVSFVCYVWYFQTIIIVAYIAGYLYTVLLHLVHKLEYPNLYYSATCKPGIIIVVGAQIVDGEGV